MPCSFSDMPPRSYPSFLGPAKIPALRTRGSITPVPGRQPSRSSAIEADGSGQDAVERERRDPIGQGTARQLRQAGQRAQPRDDLAWIAVRRPQCRQRCRAVALGQPLAGRAGDEAGMRPPRLAQAQQAIEQDLPGGGGKQVVASQHLGDAHRRVVDEHRELIGEDAVGAAQHEVADRRLRIELLRALQLVVEGDRAGRDAQAQGGRASAPALRPLRRAQVRAGAGIGRSVVLGTVRRARRSDLRARAETLVDLVAQTCQRGLVEGGALRLAIGAAPAQIVAGPRVGTLVPSQAQPGQLFQLARRQARSDAGPVEVLDAQGESATLRPGPQPGEDGGPRVAEVQLAGRARGESAALGHRAHPRERTDISKVWLPESKTSAAASKRSKRSEAGTMNPLVHGSGRAVKTDVLSTRQVAQLLGVGEATVKRWADAGEIDCFRTPGGHRKFRLRDVTAFVQRRNYQVAETLPAQLTPGEEAGGDEAIAAVEKSALAGDASSLVAQMAALRLHGHDLAVIFDDVVAPALQRIGSRWQACNLSIADEHVATQAVVEAIARAQA